VAKKRGQQQRQQAATSNMRHNRGQAATATPAQQPVAAQPQKPSVKPVNMALLAKLTANSRETAENTQANSVLALKLPAKQTKSATN